MADKIWAVGYDGWLHQAETGTPWEDSTPTNQPPVASFTTNTNNLTVTVNASASSDPDGSITNYSWNWGDSTSNGSGMTASHTYASAGNYTITLTVTDNQSATANTTRGVNPVTGGGGGGDTFATGLPKEVFAANSFWYKPLPSNAPLDSGSAAKINFLIQTGINSWGNPGKGFPSFALNNYSNTPPIVVVDNSTPIINGGAGMTLRDNGSGPYFNNLRTMFQGVRLPTNFVHDVGGSDGFLIVYNKDTDTYWDFWVVEKDASGWPGWSANRGHRIENASTKQGIAEAYGSSPPYFYYGSNAAGLAEVGGVIKLEELEAGLIPHVVNMAVPVSCVAHKENVGISAPAVRSDGASMDPNAIQMGQRVRLPAGFDVDSPNYHPVTRAVARAFRDYGAIIMDRAGDISFRGENRTALPNGTARWNAVFEGAEPYNVMWDYGGYTPFPWSSLQLVQPDYLA